MRVSGVLSFAGWALLTAVIPLGLAASARPVEEARFGGPEMTWWIVAAAVLPAAVAAARPRRQHGGHPGSPARRGGRPVSPARRDPARAIGTGLTVAAAYVTATVAVYVLVFPMEAHPVDLPVLLSALTALTGAIAGHFIARRSEKRRSEQRTGPRLTKVAVMGLAVAFVGAFLLPGTLADAAQFSTVDQTTPDPLTPHPTVVDIPAAGRYTLLADGDPPPDPGCRLLRPGTTDVQARPLTVQPEEAGYDATPAETTVADLDVATPGIYTLTCSSPGDNTDYRVTSGRSISPTADALLRWPLPLIMLLGALPGLALLADATRRRSPRLVHTRPFRRRAGTA